MGFFTAKVISGIAATTIGLGTVATINTYTGGALLKEVRLGLMDLEAKIFDYERTENNLVSVIGNVKLAANETIEAANALIANKNQTIITLKEIIAQKDLEIAALEQTILEKDAEIEELIAEKEALIAEKTILLERIASLEEELAAVEAELEATLAENANLREENINLTNALSEANDDAAGTNAFYNDQILPGVNSVNTLTEEELAELGEINLIEIDPGSEEPTENE